MANTDDQLAVAVTSSAPVSYTTTLKQNALQPLVEVVLRATTITTSLTIAIAVSLDGTNFNTLYTSPALTGVPRNRRVIFSEFSGASDADTAAVDATIFKGPILEGTIKVTLTPSGSCTWNLDVLQSDPKEL